MIESSYARIALVAVRIALGWVMLYAGVTKIINPVWSAAGYLNTAKTFSGFYAWLTQPGILPVVNFVNEWGLTLLGVSLILGVFVRLSGILGAILMILYYFPGLTFPMVGKTAFIVDEHIIYALTLLFFCI
ncbi:MAG: DoxX family membrane protein, partial [Patescibacteria group bacterium]